MRQGKTMRLRLVRLLLVARLLAFCVGCAKEPVRVGVNCPMPSQSEVDDFNTIVNADSNRPLVAWNARLIAYCWPAVAQRQRQEAIRKAAEKGE